jgi:hypothetical protein
MAPDDETSAGQPGTDPPGQKDGQADSGSAAPPKPEKQKRLSKRRKLLGEIASEELKGTGRLMAGRTAETIRAVFDGIGVDQDSVDAEVFNDSSGAITRLLAAMTGSRPRYVEFGFAHSVYVDIAAPEEELDLAEEGLREYDKAGTDEERVKLARAAIPSTLLAGLAAEDLLDASTEDVLKASLSYGTTVTDAYKALVRTLADEEISMTLELPETGEDARPARRELQVSTQTARDYKDALSAAGSQETVKVSAAGTLTMADSARKQVRLTLDKGAAKDVRLANRTAILARYTVTAYQTIRKENLWDQHVIADFEMTRNKRGTTAQRRPPSFVLIAGRPRF